MRPRTLLWLGVAGVFLAFLLAAFVYLTLRGSRSRLRGWEPFARALRRFDQWLAESAPRVHRFLRRRLTTQAWHGLALTVAAALLFGLLGLFLAITESWSTQDDLYRLDQAVHSGLADALRPGTVDFFRVVTYFGSGYVTLPLAAVVAGFLFYRKDWWRLAATVLVVGGGQALLFGLKWHFSRGRPGGMLAPAGPYSYPSGHTFSAVVLYGLLIYLAWRYVEREAARVAVATVLALLIVLVGLSRIVLSVHWTSDVLGGFAIGLAWTVLGLTTMRVSTYFALGTTSGTA